MTDALLVHSAVARSNLHHRLASHALRPRLVTLGGRGLLRSGRNAFTRHPLSIRFATASLSPSLICNDDRRESLAAFCKSASTNNAGDDALKPA